MQVVFFHFTQTGQNKTDGVIHHLPRESTATRFRAGRSYRATLSQVRLVQPIHEGAWYVHPGLLSAHEAFVAVNRELCHPSPFGIRL